WATHTRPHGKPGGISIVLLLRSGNEGWCDCGVQHNELRGAGRRGATSNERGGTGTTQARLGVLMRTISAFAIAIVALSCIAIPAHAQQATVTLDPSVASGPASGGLFVIFGRNDARDPRFQAGSYGGSVPFYGMDVDAWRAGAATTGGTDGR